MLLVKMNGVDAEHLEEVKKEMVTMGAPVLRAVDGEDRYTLLEGSHRAVAAMELGLPIVLRLVEPDLDAYLDDITDTDNPGETVGDYLCQRPENENILDYNRVVIED